MLHSGPLSDRRVQIGAATDPAGEGAHHAGVPAPEPAHVIAEAAVPFRPPALGERAHLVGAGDVPGLGDELGVAEDRVLGDALEQGGIGEHAAVHVPAEHRGEIEAEAVDVHLHDPVAQGVEDEVADDRVRRVDRLPRAGEVAIEALVGVQPVVDRVVDAPEPHRRSQLVAFARVVEDHVEDHFETRPVKGADHLLELQHLRAVLVDARVRGLGSEEAEGIVAPEVLQALARARVDPRQGVLVEFLDGHQLDRGDPQIFQVRDLLDQAAVRPGESDAAAGIDGVAADVELVDDRRCPRVAEGLVTLPVEVRVGDDALRGGRRVVDLGQGQVRLRRGRIVAHGGVEIAARQRARSRWRRDPPRACSD